MDLFGTINQITTSDRLNETRRVERRKRVKKHATQRKITRGSCKSLFIQPHCKKKHTLERQLLSSVKRKTPKIHRKKMYKNILISIPIRDSP